MRGSVIKVDFNDNFLGFEDGEKILLDTGVILALANEYDAWHNTIRNLFERHILENEVRLHLFINPTILNEITFLAGRPLQNYKRHIINDNLSFIIADELITRTINDVSNLIKEEVLLITDGNKESSLKQIELYKELGSADAANVSIADVHEMNFLTVDKRLSDNIYRLSNKLTKIKKVYYTNPSHRSY